MKIITALACLLFSFQPGPTLLVLDKNLRKPVHESTGFTTEQYQQQTFPVYASEAEAIVEATDKVVRLMEKEPVCFEVDTITAGHTVFLLIQDCDVWHNYSITMITTIDESQTSFGFSLVKNEGNKRKAQQKLLDFATYLMQ